MPETTFLDTPEGAQASESTAGLAITRAALVTGLTGNADQRIVQALRQAPNVPPLGRPHPSYPEIALISKSAAMDGNAVQLLLQYGVETETTGSSAESGSGRLEVNADTVIE